MDAVVRTMTLDDVAVVEVCGVLELATSGALREHFVALLNADHTALVADLTGVTFIDSTGLGLLVGVSKRASDHGARLQLVIDNERVLKTLRIAGLAQVFALHCTREDALAASWGPAHAEPPMWSNPSSA